MNTNTPSASASRTPEYIKIPNVPGLYRHTRSGRYYGVKKVNEKRRERSLDTTDRRIAEARLREWIFSLEKVDREVEKMTLSELTKSFVAINQGKANNSLYIMRSVVEELQEFLLRKGLGDPQVRNIRTSHLEEWLAKQERRLKNSSYNRYTGVIKLLFALAVRDRILAESPFDKVRVRWKKPQTPKRVVPTLEQFEAIIKEVRAAPFTIHAESSGDFLEFLGLAGVGQAEAASLCWGDIDFKRGLMSFRRHKTDVGFYVPIYDHLKPLLFEKGSGGLDLCLRHRLHPESSRLMIASGNSDFNPYAPPQADALVSRLRRPASSKWALAVLALDVVIYASIYVLAGQRPELMEIVEEHYDLHQMWSPYDWVLVHLIGAALPFLLLVIGGRNRLTYVIGGSGLLWACYGNLNTLFLGWYYADEEPRDLWTEVIDLSFFLLMAGAWLYLLHRFLFGLPSRQYYRIGRKSGPAKV